MPSGAKNGHFSILIKQACVEHVQRSHCCPQLLSELYKNVSCLRCESQKTLKSLRRINSLEKQRIRRRKWAILWTMKGDAPTGCSVHRLKPGLCDNGARQIVNSRHSFMVSVHINTRDVMG